MNFIKWLGSFVERDGVTSSKKLALIYGATALSFGVLSLLLAKASWIYHNGGDCSMEIAAASIPLCALAGVAYSLGKPSDRKDANIPD